MRKFLLPSLVAGAALALLALLTFGVSRQNDTSSIDGQVACGIYPVAPSSGMSLPVLGTSRAVDLKDFRGKVVVLNIFASWCPSCATEARLLAPEQHMLARRGATIVGVTYEDASSSTQAFDHRYGVSYPVLRDVSGDSFVRWGPTRYPRRSSSPADVGSKRCGATR